MKRIYLIATLAFFVGYAANDVVQAIGIQPAYADVAGMKYYDLKRDRDFKKAVQYIVDDCTVTGDVDDGYMYYGDVSC